MAFTRVMRDLRLLAAPGEQLRGGTNQEDCQLTDVDATLAEMGWPVLSEAGMYRSESPKDSQWAREKSSCAACRGRSRAHTYKGDDPMTKCRWSGLNHVLIREARKMAKGIKGLPPPQRDALIEEAGNKLRGGATWESLSVELQASMILAAEKHNMSDMQKDSAENVVASAEEQRKSASKNQSASDDNDNPRSVGSHLDVLVKDTEEKSDWYPCTVTEVLPRNRVRVQWDNGDESETLHLNKECWRPHVANAEVPGGAGDCNAHPRANVAKVKDEGELWSELDLARLIDSAETSAGEIGMREAVLQAFVARRMTAEERKSPAGQAALKKEMLKFVEYKCIGIPISRQSIKDLKATLSALVLLAHMKHAELPMSEWKYKGRAVVLGNKIVLVCGNHFIVANIDQNEAASESTKVAWSKLRSELASLAEARLIDVWAVLNGFSMKSIDFENGYLQKKWPKEWPGHYLVLPKEAWKLLPIEYHPHGIRRCSVAHAWMHLWTSSKRPPVRERGSRFPREEWMESSWKAWVSNPYDERSHLSVPIC